MKKAAKILATILMFLAVVPLIAGFTTTALWNNILTSACGFSPIGLWQGVGIFLLGQILSGGFVIGCFFTVGSIHHTIGHSRGEIRQHWHKMTDDQRKEFMERRARLEFRPNHHSNDDAAER